MTLKEVQTVVIDLGCAKKFIVVVLSDETGTIKKVVRTYNLLSYERIFERLICELYGNRVTIKSYKCLGGGIMVVTAEEKRIVLCGQSLQYGKEPDRAETIQLIQEAYPDFRVEERTLATI